MDSGRDRAQAMGDVQVTSLGTFRVATHSGDIDSWGAGGSRAAFQFLLAHRHQVIPRSELRAVIWPERADERVGNSLSVALRGVRRTLADHGSGLAVERVGVGYRIVGEAGRALSVDVDDLAVQVEVARAAARAGDVAAELRAAESVVALYGGDFLPGEDAEWVRTSRAWYRSSVLRALHGARATALRAGRHDDAMRLCRGILAVDSCDEASYQTLMWVHGRTGQRANVAQWFAICTGRLADELEVEPTPLTRHLFDRIMRGAQAALHDVPLPLLEVL